MKSPGFSRYAWCLIGYNLLVIMWGAYVRATGSGAGCGAHWPTCNGQVIPLGASTEMLVEYTHRISSGLVLPLVLLLVFWSIRSFPRGHLVRWGALFALFFTITEALVGAGLVLFKLVGDNNSSTRALVIAIHLTNTFMLLASLTLTAWWASGGKPIHLRGQGGFSAAFGLAWIGMFGLGISGAITALGDTLFPSGSLVEGFQQDLSPTAHFLIRLRIIHPMIAIGMGVYLVGLALLIRKNRTGQAVRWLSASQIALFVIQLILGGINVALLAPVAVQMIHLLVADLVWINLILLTAAGLKENSGPVAVPRGVKTEPASLSH